jgi:rhodanese-related sulfurtransferase
MNSLGSLNKVIPTVIYCQTGNKSKAVVSMLKKQNFAEVYNLVGGIHEWVTQELNP